MCFLQELFASSKW